MKAGFFPVNRMRNEFPGLPSAVGFAAACPVAGAGAGKLASFRCCGNGRALKSLRKIEFVLHYFLSRFFAGGAGWAARRRAARSVIEETAQWSKTTGAPAFSAGLLSGVAAK
jgi:hypothetical protein